MLLSILLSAVFLGILGLFGALLGIYILKIHDTFGIVAAAMTLGIAFYVTIANALAYILPIRTSFGITLGLLFVGCVLLVLRGWQSKGGGAIVQEKAPWKMFLLLGLICLFVGYAYARDRGSDEWVWTTYPLPATIIEGNFPVVEPANPWERIAYHYSPQFLVAALTWFSGINFASAYSLLAMISTGGILFSAAALGWKFSRSWGIAVLAGVMALGAAGLFWLQGFHLLSDLLHQYVFHTPLPPLEGLPSGVFRWVTPMIRNLPGESLLPLLGHRAVALGAAFTWMFLYGLYSLWNTQTLKQSLPWLIVSIVLATELALTIELSFAIILAAMAVYAGLVAIGFAKTAAPKNLVLWTAAIIIAISSVIALIQGGPLSTLHGSVSPNSFSPNLTGRLEIAISDNIPETIPRGLFWQVPGATGPSQ